MICRRRTPKYRHYKPKNLAVVRINGRDHYLGPYGSPESQARYHRLLAEWLSDPLTPVVTATVQPKRDWLTINELILAYLLFAQTYYVKDGRPTDEQACLRSALRLLRQLYGTLLVKGFGPLKLKAVRAAMVQAGLCRRVINQHVGRIRRMIKWAVESELVDVQILQALWRTGAPLHQQMRVHGSKWGGRSRTGACRSRRNFPSQCAAHAGSPRAHNADAVSQPGHGPTKAPWIAL